MKNLIKKTTKFSKRINYGAIESLLGGTVFSPANESHVPAPDVEYQFSEKGETLVFGDGEEEIVEEEGGGVGMTPRKPGRALSEVARTEDEEPDEELDLDDDTGLHFGRKQNFEEEYNYDEAYEQEVD